MSWTLSGRTTRPTGGSVSPLALRDGRGDRVGTPRWSEPEGSLPAYRVGRAWPLAGLRGRQVSQVPEGEPAL